tara:strand:- start:160 stop:1287 length:1128 start_codon:yes stop_codon:yes gene_type:complete
MNRQPTAIDLFCGVGGMSLGFEQAGFNVLAAYDAEEFNVQSHNLNFPRSKAFKADLSKQDASDLRKLARIGRRNIDVVFGGPPCQGFSVGGRRDLNDKRNLLVFDFARLVRQFRPSYFVMENVQGLMTEHSKPILDSFLRRVKRAGYGIVEPIRVLNASDFGVPQRRKRTIILGFLKDVPEPEYPDKCCDGNLTTHRSVVRDAIADLQIVEDHNNFFECDVFAGELPETQSIYAKTMRGLIHCPTDFSIPREITVNRLTGCLRTRHSTTTTRRFKKTKQGTAEPISRYIRLSWDSVAPTLRAGTGVDRGSHTAPRPIHPSVPRCITTREAARLHSFPDWFQFHETRWHGFRQIGNAVPPLLARAVAGKIAEALSK